MGGTLGARVVKRSPRSDATGTLLPSSPPSPIRPHSIRRFLLLGALLVIALLVAGLNWRWSLVTWQIQQARQTLRQNAPSEALSILLRAERHQPERPELLFLLGRVHRQLGNFREASHYLLQAEQRGWNQEDLRHQRILAELQSGNVEFADEYLQELLRSGASDERALEFFAAHAQGLLRLYRLADALVCLDFWIEWRPQDVQARMWRADIWERILRWRAAAAEYRTILEIEPNHAEARRQLAQCLLELHENAAALPLFEQCLTNDPSDLLSALGAAKCYRRITEDPSEAERRYQAILSGNWELLPEQRAEVLTELGQIAMQRREFPEAQTMLEEAIALQPTDAAAHHQLGRVHAHLGDLEQSRYHHETSQQLYAQFGRLSDIMRELLTSTQAPDLRWEAGKILLELGLEREGVAWLETALHEDPSHQPTQQTLAEYRAGQGNSKPTASDQYSFPQPESSPLLGR
jgi:tetratricopeptide (TPR) repeat protein